MTAVWERTRRQSWGRAWQRGVPATRPLRGGVEWRDRV